MDEFQDVSIKVPQARVAEFYRFFGEWLAGAPQPGNGAGKSVGTGSEHKAWGADDSASAEKLWESLTETGRKFFRLLFENPGKRLSGTEIAKRLKLKNRFVTAGALAWPGRHSYGLGFRHPVEFGETDGDTCYWMEPAVASLFERAARSHR